MYRQNVYILTYRQVPEREQKKLKTKERQKLKIPRSNKLLEKGIGIQKHQQNTEKQGEGKSYLAIFNYTCYRRLDLWLKNTHH